MTDRSQLRLSRAAHVLDIPVRTLRDYALTGRIQAIKIGKHWFVPVKEIHRIMEGGLEDGERQVISLLAQKRTGI